MQPSMVPDLMSALPGSLPLVVEESLQAWEARGISLVGPDQPPRHLFLQRRLPLPRPRTARTVIRSPLGLAGVAALTCEATRASTSPFEPVNFDVCRPHRGQMTCAERLRLMLEGSKLVNSKKVMAGGGNVSRQLAVRGQRGGEAWVVS